MKYKTKQAKTFSDMGTIASDWENYGLIEEVLEPEHCQLCDHFPIIHIYLIQ